MLADVNLTGGAVGDGTIGLRDRVLLLEALDMGGILDNHALTLVAEHTRPRRFRQGDLLLRDGEPINRVFLITEGRVTVTQRGRPVRVFDESGAVGLNAVLAGDDSGVQAVADRDTHTLAIPTDILMDLYEANFLLVRNALSVLSNQVLEDRDDLPLQKSEEPSMGEWRDRPRTFVERIIEVRRGPFFGETNLDAVLEFARQGYEIRGSAGDMIWDAGESSNYWISVDYGRMRCTSPDGRSVIIGADYSLGVMDAMAARARSYRVEATTDFIAYRINRDVMLAIMEGHFDLSMVLLRSLSGMVFRNAAASSDMSDHEVVEQVREL